MAVPREVKMEEQSRQVTENKGGPAETCTFAPSPTIPKDNGWLKGRTGKRRLAGPARAPGAQKNPPGSIVRRLHVGYDWAGRPLCGARRPQAPHPFGPAFWLLLVCVPWLWPGRLRAEKGNEAIRDASGEYHFLNPDDTLGLLEEDGKIKGYIDVYQGEEESDTVLSYPITIGTRQKNHIEFKTGKIHQKYYRFSGTVERGKGHEEAAPDYLRLVGDLEIVTVKPDTGHESTERRRVILQSKGRAEREQE
jgi:hypothetical protein